MIQAPQVGLLQGEMHAIYLARNGRQAGPFTPEKIQQMLTAGEISGGDLAWHEGLNEWKPLSMVANLPILPATHSAVQTAPAKTRLSTLLTGLICCGAAAILLLLMLAGVIGVFAFKGAGLNGSSKAYVDDYVSHIAPAWSADELGSRETPAYQEKFDPATMRAIFRKLSLLGNLRHYDGSRGRSNMKWELQGWLVSANYTAKATYEHGNATFNLVLIQVAGRWTIAGFHVDSPVFYQ